MSGDHWKDMSPREVWEEIEKLNETLRHAPKVAGPWQRAKSPAYDGCTYEWRTMAPELREGRVYLPTAAYVGEDNRPWDDDEERDGFAGFFNSREEADTALVAAGWLLIGSTSEVVPHEC